LRNNPSQPAQFLIEEHDVSFLVEFSGQVGQQGVDTGASIRPYRTFPMVCRNKTINCLISAQPDC
ncbi:hypothetical protein, partial [Fretibacterium fastidiosum]|uniref:hypothetical protein n=1 Tax=Fretibacterium fastidiosum TaxID=651822 RepID=UPI001AD81C6C